MIRQEPRDMRFLCLQRGEESGVAGREGREQEAACVSVCKNAGIDITVKYL